MAVLDYRTAGQSPYRRSLHLLALLTATATLFLIFLGGLVTSHGAGMSVPDWPNSYGYNMFTFPISKWVGGIFYEHTHRLMGSTVGFLSVLLALNAWGTGQGPRARLWLWIAAGASALFAACCALEATRLTQRGVSQAIHGLLIQFAVGLAGLVLVLVCATFMRQREPRRWVRWLSIAILIAVIAQGILGGLRVVNVNLELAIVHACVAQACFCLMALICVATSRWWFDVSREHPDAGGSLIWLAGISAIAIYLQLIAGAVVRHYQAGLAIPDFPASYGSALPPISQAEMEQINHQRANMDLPPVSLGQVWLHFGHRAGAAIVSWLVIWEVIWVLRDHREPGLRSPARILIGLLPVQLTLGILTVLLRKPADIASLHVAVGALTLVTSFVLLIRSMRVYSPLWRRAPRYLEIRVTPRRTIVPA